MIVSWYNTLIICLHIVKLSLHNTIILWTIVNIYGYSRTISLLCTNSCCINNNSWHIISIILCCRYILEEKLIFQDIGPTMYICGLFWHCLFINVFVHLMLFSHLISFRLVDVNRWYLIKLNRKSWCFSNIAWHYSCNGRKNLCPVWELEKRRTIIFECI